MYRTNIIYVQLPCAVSIRIQQNIGHITSLAYITPIENNKVLENKAELEIIQHKFQWLTDQGAGYITVFHNPVDFFMVEKSTCKTSSAP